MLGLNDKEKVLVPELLEIACNEFASQICSDLPDDFWNNWHQKKRKTHSGYV